MKKKKKNKNKIELLKMKYRALEHNICYKENYFRNIMIILVSFILLNLILLYLVW